MNDLITQAFKYRLNWAAFACFVLAVSLVQTSYIFNGIWLLDFGVLLLIPSFLFFIIWLLQEWTTESKDYCVGLTLIIAAVVITLLSKYKFQVGVIDDGYHTFKMIAYSVKNSFSSKFLGGSEDARFYLIDFIENIWGLAWRFIRWDYIVVLIQILPVFILWRQLVEFFRNRKLEQVSGFISAVIILSMQIIWAQACSTYVDSLAGIIAALTLLKIADLLSFPQSRDFYNISTTALLSVLCLLPKASLVFLAVFGLGVSFWFALTVLSKKQVFITALTLLPSLGFCIKHYAGVWQRQGTPFYPWCGSKTVSVAAASQVLENEWYRAHHLFHFKPIYIFATWLYDYRLGFVTPAPTADVGNGLLWTYFVVPVLAIALIVSIFRFREIKGFHPSVLLLIFLVLYYYLMDASIVVRYIFGFNLFIMAWAFTWVLRRFKETGWTMPRWFSMTAGCLVLVLSLLSFFQSIRGAFLEYRVVSVLEAQRQLFPKHVRAGSFQEDYCAIFLEDYKGQPVSSDVRSFINECKAESYKQPIKNKELRFRPQDYKFDRFLIEGHFI